MRAGRLRHRVALQQPTRVTSGTGFTETWTTYAETWAEIAPATPDRVSRIVAQTTQTPITHLVTLRYRPGVRAQHRVLFGTRPLYIAGLQNEGERDRSLVLACEERTL